MFHCSVLSRVLNTFHFSPHFSSPHARILSGFSCQILFGVFDSRFIIIAASVKDVQRVWPGLLISLQPFKQWAPSDVSSCCWKVIWVFHACCLMPKNLSSFNRGASFGNLAKVNFTCCWFLTSKFFFGMRAYFLTLFGLPFWLLRRKKKILGQISVLNLMCNSITSPQILVFSLPGSVSQPDRIWNWHDIIGCNVINQTTCFLTVQSIVKVFSRLPVMLQQMIPRLDAYKKKCLKRYYPEAGREKTGSKFKSSHSHLNLWH